MTATLPESAHRPSRTAPITANSPAMRELLGLAERIADTKLPVLIHGETGSGKEVIARAIHELSLRHTHPYVAVNCAALPPTLAEAELFGVVRGAFTGATADKKGLFEAAENGTLLLDEVGELELGLQGKLLRVLEESEVRMVGALRATRINVRVVAATHRDLEQLVAARAFREDLYYRLNGVTLTVPPLRDRPEDFEPLLKRFIAEAAGDRELPVVPSETLEQLKKRRWSGNVRELRQAALRAVALGGPVLSEHDFGQAVKSPLQADAISSWLIGQRWRDIERSILSFYLERYPSLRAAAVALGLPKSTLADRIREHKLICPWMRHQSGFERSDHYPTNDHAAEGR